MLEAARANPVGAFFVLLDLLESQPKRVGKVCLCHVQHHATHADLGTDVLIHCDLRLRIAHSCPLTPSGTKALEISFVLISQPSSSKSPQLATQTEQSSESRRRETFALRRSARSFDNPVRFYS